MTSRDTTGTVSPAGRRPSRRRTASAARRPIERAHHWPPAVVVVAYLALAVAFFAPALLSHGHRWAGMEGDAQQTMWDLAWVPYALAHGHTGLLTNELMAPRGANLLESPTTLLPDFVLAPATVALGAVTSYALAQILALAGSAAAAYLALRAYVRREWAAAIGGALYGFSPFVVDSALGSHLQLAFAWFPPVVLLCLDRMIRGRHRLWAGVGLGAATAAQVFTGEELLATTVLMAAMTVVALAVLHPGRAVAEARRFAGAAAVAAVTGAVLAGGGLWFQFAGPQRVSGRLVAPGIWVTDPVSMIVPTSFQQFAPGWAVTINNNLHGNPVERSAYFGIPLLVVLVVATVRLWRVTAVRTAAVIGLIALLLSLGPQLYVNGRPTGIPLPWRLVAHLPFFGNALASRLSVFAFLAAAVVLAVALDRLAPHLPRPVPLAASCLAVASLVPLVPRIPPVTTQVATPAFFRDGQVRRMPAGAVALIEPLGNPFRAVMWQFESGFRFRLTDGALFIPGPRVYTQGGPLITALGPLELGLPPPRLTPRLASAARAQLAAERVRTVIVGPFGVSPVPRTPRADVVAGANLDAPEDRQAVAYLTRLLGRPPVRDHGVEVWWHVGTA